MSGSRGEANFVWKCKNCKVVTLDSTIIVANWVTTARINGLHQGSTCGL